MGYFPVRYDSRVVIYEHKMFIRLATGLQFTVLFYHPAAVVLSPMDTIYVLPFLIFSYWNYLSLDCDIPRKKIELNPKREARIGPPFKK